MTDAVVKRVDELPQPILSTLRKVMPDCSQLLPEDMPLLQFRAALWLELSGRPGLHDCTIPSLRAAVIRAATHGLLPGRDCHFLPFTDKRQGKQATCVVNYQGFLRSLYRTGMVETAFAEVVYANDLFELDYGRTAQPLVHKPPRKHRGAAEGAYGYILARGSGHPLIHYMAQEDIDRVRRRAPAHESGPWVTDPGEMWRKTALKNCAKYAMLTPQAVQLLDEETERERQDIPPARHAENVAVLFDNAPPTSGRQPTGPEPLPLLVAHQDNPGLSLPLREAIAAALTEGSTSPAGEMTQVAEDVRRELAALDATWEEHHA